MGKARANELREEVKRTSPEVANGPAHARGRASRMKSAGANLDLRANQPIKFFAVNPSRRAREQSARIRQSYSCR
jgi:hypothetical protein